jgi:lysophospholipase L1-like esterase
VHFTNEARDILIVGSSTTAGTGPSSLDKAYVSLVEAARPLDNFQVFSEGGSDVDDWASQVITPLPHNQDIVILQLGINLWLAGTSSVTFEANCKALFDNLRFYNPICQIYFIRGWMPRTSYDSQLTLWDTYSDILTSFESNTYIRPFTFLDMLEDNLDLYYQTGQGIHYNDIGHQLLANRLLAYI